MTTEAFDRVVVPGSANADPASASPSSGLYVYQLATGVALGETVLPPLSSTVALARCNALWLEIGCDDGAGTPVGFYVAAGPARQIPLGAVPAAGTPDPTMTAAGANPQNMATFIAPGRVWHRHPARWCNQNSDQMRPGSSHQYTCGSWHRR